MSQIYQDEQFIRETHKADLIIDELPDFTKKYFTHLKGSSAKTRLSYAYDLKRFFTWLEQSAGFKDEDIRFMKASDILDVLTLDDIQEYLDTLEYHTNDSGKRSSASSRARKASSLRSFYRYYFQIGEIEHNMADLIDVPEIPNKPVIALNASQVKRLIDAINDESNMNNNQILRHRKTVKRDIAIVVTFLGTGIRISELVGIDIENIDFQEASILITRKGGDQDEVFFSQEVEDVLKDYLENGRPLLNPSPSDHALFISMQHKRMSVRSVEDMVKQHSLKAGLNQKITPHKFRSSYATNLYENTNDLYLVRDALHHSSVQTSTRYTRMDREHKRTAASKASSLISEK